MSQILIQTVTQATGYTSNTTELVSPQSQTPSPNPQPHPPTQKNKQNYASPHENILKMKTSVSS